MHVSINDVASSFHAPYIRWYFACHAEPSINQKLHAPDGTPPYATCARVARRMIQLGNHQLLEKNYNNLPHGLALEDNKL